jgi:large subunit ribosomal protein L17
MRHRVHGRKLGRTPAHRKALFRNQLTALFTHDRIITTVAKAKELRPVAERMVTLARTGTLSARRRVATMVQDKEIAQRLFEEIAPRFADRPGGYTRIMRLGRRRGDNAELAIIEFIDYELAEHQDDGEGQGKGSFMDRAKGMFGSGAAGSEAAADDAETTEAGAETAADDEAEAVEAEAVTDEPVEAEAAADEATTDDEPVETKADDDAVEETAAAEPEPADEPEAASEETAAEPAADEEKKDA